MREHADLWVQTLPPSVTLLCREFPRYPTATIGLRIRHSNP